MTSFAFMFVCVPLPVCQTKSGKCASSLPSITSSAARDDDVDLVLRAACFSSPLVSAAAFLRMPSARIIGRGKCSSPMLKWCSDRSVCAPQ